jgi:predicted DNA-binding transcriptional regulator YafY
MIWEGIMEQNGVKSARLLEIYSRLSEGAVLKKSELAQDFHVTQRSIQRDIEDLRCFFAERHLEQDVIYDTKLRGYRLIQATPKGLSNSEILAVCKILLESRSMRKDEMLPILDKLIFCAVPESSQKAVKALIANEELHYVEPHHNRPILDGLWEIGQAIKNQQIIEIEYERMKEPRLVRRRVQPVGIMFSEYYFYLTAFLEDKTDFENPDDLFPTIYRIDRIHSFKVLDEHFRIPYTSRFEEGEFRKRIQFMYGGKLERVKFRYSGPSIEAVLDRLPTARILSQDENGWTVEAEAFGKGIEMWLRSQGDFIEATI